VPIFKSTANILKTVNQDEVFNPDWMNYNTVQTPPKFDWDYSRELKIEDIDIWEVIYEGFSGTCLYAAWSPYAEFYMLLYGLDPSKAQIETFYGKGANKEIIKKIKELKIPIAINSIWVDDDEMWLYQ
jgi:hypothetical protein